MGRRSTGRYVLCGGETSSTDRAICLGLMMSNFIPPAAVSSAVNSVVRPANDAAFARKVQSMKNAHHAEDVEDLVDGGVEAVRDEEAGGNAGEDGEKRGKNEAEDRVEIESLGEVVPVQVKGIGGEARPRLDISA